MIRAFTVGFFLVWTLGFVRPASPQAPKRTVSHVVYVSQVVPPAEWETIYHEVERCYGKRGDFTAVRWYVTSDVWQGESGDVAGLWREGDKRGPQIIAVRGDTAVVRHEALHDVMYANGFKPTRAAADTTNNPEHPIPPFDKCAQRRPKLTAGK